LALTVLLASGCQRDEAPAAPEKPPAAVASEPASADGALVPTPEATPAAAQPETAIPAEMSVADLLIAARTALTDERLATPAGNSAIDFYVAVIERDPDNLTAAQALVDIFPMAVAVAEREIAQGRLDDAERIAALLDRASPGSFSVRSLRERIATTRAAQDRVLVQEQERQRLAAEQARIEAQQAAAPPEPVPVPAPSVAPAPVAAAPPLAPAPVAPPVAATPPPPVGETRSARPLRQVQPAYPSEALRRRQRGWVELSFTVGLDGRVGSVQVTRSQPIRVFDREAITAMQQWTFEPALRDGQPVASQGARRMEFQL